MGFFDWLFQSLPLFYTFNAVVSAIVAYFATISLKQKFIDKRWHIFLFSWTLAFIFPIVGYFMVAWIVYYLLNIEYDTELKDYQIINMEEFFSDFPKIHRLFGESGIEKLLSSDNAPKALKLKALTSLSDNSKRDDIEMIKRMLSDGDDEVRLYSFSIINKLERNLNNKIHKKLKEFKEQKDTKRRVVIAGELAHLYWDLVYYQLSDEDLKAFIIKEVERYSNFVLKQDSSDPKINLLLGKVYLYQKKYNTAQLYITTALKRGVNRDFILPYLAEIFYQKREFSTVKKLFRTAENIKYNSTLYPIILQWREGK